MGRQLKQSVKVFQSFMLNLRLPEEEKKWQKYENAAFNILSDLRFLSPQGALIPLWI